MTEDQLRAVIRDAIARHARQAPPPAVPLPVMRQHASHTMFAVPDGAETGGPCVIEPAVACNHCGFCKSYGH